VSGPRGALPYGTGTVYCGRGGGDVAEPRAALSPGAFLCVLCHRPVQLHPVPPTRCRLKWGGRGGNHIAGPHILFLKFLFFIIISLYLKSEADTNSHIQNYLSVYIRTSRCARAKHDLFLSTAYDARIPYCTIQWSCAAPAAGVRWALGWAQCFLCS